MISRVWWVELIICLYCSKYSEQKRGRGCPRSIYMNGSEDPAHSVYKHNNSFAHLAGRVKPFTVMIIKWYKTTKCSSITVVQQYINTNQTLLYDIAVIAYHKITSNTNTHTRLLQTYLLSNYAVRNRPDHLHNGQKSACTLYLLC